MTDFNNQIAKILWGTTLADAQQVLIAQTAKQIQSIRGRAPCLAVLLVGEHPSSVVYVAAKQKACQKVGIESRVVRLSDIITQQKLLEQLIRLNNDPSVDGILIQLPLPKGLDANTLLDALNPAKDVDGLTPHNLGLLMSRRPAFIPCTPLGCMDLIKSVTSPAGKNAVVFGRSLLVGRPMALLLEQANATVTIVHSHSANGKAICREADIVVAAIGHPGFITADYIKPNAVVIDVGQTRHENKLLGDAHESITSVAGWLTPVPGGVGPMTITKLLSNTIVAAQGKINHTEL